MTSTQTIVSNAEDNLHHGCSVSVCSVLLDSTAKKHTHKGGNGNEEQGGGGNRHDGSNKAGS